MNSGINEVLSHFDIRGRVISVTPYGNGHINDTKLILAVDDIGCEHRYIIQKINKNVFKDPERLMENYFNVTRFIRKKVKARGGDPEREGVNVIRTKDGRTFVYDKAGEPWRLLVCVQGCVCYDKVENTYQFYQSGVAFGNFQYMLNDYPADTLYETIVDFHNTPNRYSQLMEAVQNDAAGRLSQVLDEVEFVKARKEFTYIFENAHKSGKLPLRVTHNDTKLNNVLFDAKTGKTLCVVDLDTIMPGYSVNDFGDSIRFGATTALEDEKDLSKVNFDIELYEAYAKGFIEGANGGLTDSELELLPIGAIMMTLECGMRFLADYLNGDVYFKVHREGHNLDRARNQFKLVLDMESQLDKMLSIIKKYT